MGAPTIGGVTTGSVTENSGAVITGNLDDVGFATSNTDDTWSISSSASYGTATINPTTGVWSYDLNDSHPAVHALDPGDTLTDVFTVFMLDADGRSDTQVVTITINGAVCFAAGTMIETPDGPCPVETLTAGDLVETVDHGPQPLRWIGRMSFSAAQAARDASLRPVRIEPGALGPGCPRTPLRVSRQHRLLVTGEVALCAFGTSEALIPAIQLTDLPGIALERSAGRITYYHLLLDQHEILLADGAPCESFLLGRQALRTLSPEALAEVAEIFPDIRAPGFVPRPARTLGRDGRRIRAWLRALARGDKTPIELVSAQPAPA